MDIALGLRRATTINGEGIATIFGDRVQTWNEVRDRVARIGTVLRAHGIARGDRVAVMMQNSDRYLELYLATAWVGAVIVPLNLRWSIPENQYALKDSGTKVMIVDDAYLDEGERLKREFGDALAVFHTGEKSSVTIHDFERVIALSEPSDAEENQSGDLAGIFYTGGTTGAPKGVMLSHGNLVKNALNALAEGLFGFGTTYLHAAPMFHLANGAAMYGVIFNAGTNVILPSFAPVGVLELIEKHGVTDVILVPTMMQLVVDCPEIGTFETKSLRRITYGASPMNAALVERTIANFPNAKLTQLYGMTELSPIATVLHNEYHHGEERERGRHLSVGRPTFGVEIRIIDANGDVLPTETVGEICVRADTVMMGYWNLPEESREAKAGGWMHTGDGGRMDKDGFVYLADRIKDMIITGGENVYSVEVENVVSAFPGVALCAVIGIPHEKWGEQVHAVIVSKDGQPVDTDALITFCKSHIAGYKVPRSFDFVESLPLSGAGKILKQALRERHRL